MISDEGMNEFIKKVAGNVASSFPEYVETDDVTSELWVWYLENEDTVRSMITDNESWEPMLYGTMARVASTFALKLEADYHGYSPDDVYYYSTPVVKELLKDVFDYEDWQSFSSFGDGQPKAKRQTPTSDRVDMLIDVKRGLEQITERQYNIIVWRYKYGFDDELIAQAMEIKPVSVPKTLDRAVEALKRKMGKKPIADMRGAWSQRSVDSEGIPRSTAQALAYQDSNY